MRRPPSLHTAVVARLAAAASSLLLMGWLGPARGAGGSGDPGCDLVVRGAGAERWRGAVADLRRRASVHAMPLTCQKLAVQVHARGATLLFRVPDGRIAVRTLARPRELWPTVVALSVTLPRAPAPSPPLAAIVPRATDPWPPAPLPTARVASPERGEADAGDAPSPAVEQNGLSSEALKVALDAGLRTGSAGLTSARMSALAALTSSNAELGVLAAWEPAYVRPGDDSVRGARHGLSAGAFAGSRRPLWGQIALVGARAEVAVLRDERAASRAEARVGAYAGLVSSDVLPVPLRATVALDVLPAELGASRSGAPSPWWAVSLGLGVEFGGA